MKSIIYFFIVLSFSFVFNSCIKDNTNYNITWGNTVAMKVSPTTYTGFLRDTIRVVMTRTYSNVNDTTDFSHEWYVNGTLYSTTKDLAFYSEKMGSFVIRYYIIDNKTGVRSEYGPNITINVTSPFQSGWGILYEKDGKSELAHIRLDGTTYRDSVGLYKIVNGEDMGSLPVKIRDYPVTGSRGMMVLQHGGQGSIELNSYSLEKQLVTNNSFIGAAPADFKPVDCGFYATSDMLVNYNGDVYTRFFNAPVPFTTPWINSKTIVPQGMQITDIWDMWATMTAYVFMYDKLNNRVLYVRLDAPKTTGGINVIDTFPVITPVSGQTTPANYAYPNNLGNWDYIWGGSFKDASLSCDGGMLLKNRTSGDVYYQAFSSKSVNRLLQWAPKTSYLFNGGPFLTAASKFTALKSREYLFFTGGPTNTNLYYFDVRSGGAVKLYRTYASPITDIEASDDSNSIGVGLQDGTVILQDVSSAVLINGTAPELHRLTGLGKVVDVIVKGGNMR